MEVHITPGLGLCSPLLPLRQPNGLFTGADFEWRVRTSEHFGESDRGVIMMCNRLLEEAEGVARGEEPKALQRRSEVLRRANSASTPVELLDRFAQYEIDVETKRLLPPRPSRGPPGGASAA